MQQTKNRPFAFSLFGKFGRITCLVSLMVFEIVVWASFKYFGWNESLRLGGVSAFLIIVGLPLFVAVGLLLWSWRLSIRRMLMAISLIAFFLAAVAIPYQRFSVDRYASLALTSAGAYLSAFDEAQQYSIAGMDNRGPSYRSQRGAFAVLSEKTIKWLLPSIGKCPLDLEVYEVAVQSDQQINSLIAMAERLPNLRVIHFQFGVTNNGLLQFADAASLFPRFESVRVQCSSNFQSEAIRNFRGLRRIDLYSGSPNSPTLPTRLGKVIAEIGPLESVVLQGFSVSPNAFAEWEDAEIKHLALWDTRPILTKTELCRFSIVSPDIQVVVYPIPKQ
jgi:hypothetical protein